jgi:hypothetical protein
MLGSYRRLIMLDEEYYRLHECCPICGNDCIETTCVGYLNRDMNKARCKCGWTGLVDDLVQYNILAEKKKS